MNQAQTGFPADIMKTKACFACLTNCVKLHGEEDDGHEEELIFPAGSSGPQGRKQNVAAEPGPNVEGGRPAEPSPSFLKKMVDLNSMTPALQMPASFVKSFGTRIGTKVTLEGPGNEKWEVQVGPGKDKYNLEFRDGWHKFVVDHVLQIGDQLSFTLSAESTFQVMVYDESGSQKKSATDAINSPPTLLQAKALEPVDQGGGPSVPFRNKPSARPKQKVRRRIRTDTVVPLVKPESVSAPVVLSSESELRNCSDTPGMEKRSKATASEAKKDDAEEESDPGDPLLPPHVLVGGHVVSQRRPVTQAERERALIAARALPITNPKLVVVMSRAYVYRGFWLALSRPFAKAYMPKETREVTMLNVAGHKWTVKWLFKDTGSGFSAGWRGFALDHRLEHDDVCVFELLDQKNYVMVVHIFRVIGGVEDTRDYSCTPGKSRNADWIQTPTGFKRKVVEADAHTPGPSSRMKSYSTTPGKYKAAVPVTCSEIDHDPGYGKKAKASSPTTSCEVYAEYASFVTPPVGDKETLVGSLGTDLIRLPKLQSAAANRESCRNDLLKLGKELAKGTNLSADSRPSSSSSAKSEGSEEVKLVLPIDGTSTFQEMDQDPNQAAGTCTCVSEDHVSL